MANRFPLVLSSNEIRELPSIDNLDLTGSSIVGANNISAVSLTINGGTIGASVTYADIPDAPTQLSDLTNDIGLTISNDFSDITSKPTSLAGYGITDAATLVQGQKADSAIQPGGNLSSLNNDTNFITLADVTGEITVNPTGDLQGSVFADNSTLLVDGTNGNVPSSVVVGAEATNWSTAYSWGDHSVAGYLTSVAYADLTSTPTTIAGYGITDAFDGTFASLTGKPSTLAGYGITAALTDIGIVEGIDGQFLMTDGAGSFTFETIAGGGGITDVSSDTTPQLGGNLDLNSNNITGTGEITITGTVTATNFVSSGTGTPTLESATNIVLDAANNINLKINTATIATISSTGLAADITGDITGSVFSDDSSMIIDGVSGTIVGPISKIVGDVQQISGPGAISLDTLITEITTTGTDDAYSLADGILGQIKIIAMVGDGGDAILTPTTLVTGTNVTFGDVNDNITLLFTSNGWLNTANQGAIIA